VTPIQTRPDPSPRSWPKLQTQPLKEQQQKTQLQPQPTRKQAMDQDKGEDVQLHSVNKTPTLENDSSQHVDTSALKKHETQAAIVNKESDANGEVTHNIEATSSDCRMEEKESDHHDDDQPPTPIHQQTDGNKGSDRQDGPSENSESASGCAEQSVVVQQNFDIFRRDWGQIAFT